MQYKTNSNFTGPGSLYKIFSVVEVRTTTHLVHDYTRTVHQLTRLMCQNMKVQNQPLSVQFPFYVDLVHRGSEHF